MALNTVIILVHGTFAPGARWTRRFSPLVHAINASLDSDQTLVIPFGWSGKNSHRERSAAAKELIGLITDLRRLHPEARFLLIGHSHGGNVSLMVAAHPAVSDAVLGSVCLATPFLVLRDRRSALELQGLVVSILAAVIALSILGYLPYEYHGGLEALLSHAYALDSFWKWPATLAVLALFPLALVIMLSGAAAAFMGAGSYMERIPRLSSVVWRRLRMPTRLASPVLCVRYKGDEAAAWLRFVATVTSLPFSIWDWTAAGCLLMTVLGVGAFAVLVILPFRGFLIEHVGPWLSESLGAIGGVLLIIWAVGFCLTAIVTALISARSIGFGSYVPGSALLVNVRASVEPPTTLSSTVVALSPWEALRRIKAATGEWAFPWPGVVHSLAYRDPAAIAAIAGWVGERIAPAAIHPERAVRAGRSGAEHS